jgi:hypothetical protein
MVYRVIAELCGAHRRTLLNPRQPRLKLAYMRVKLKGMTSLIPVAAIDYVMT